MDDIFMEDLIDEGAVLKERLREARDLRKSLTNQEIADRAGLSLATVNNYFANRTKSSSAFTVGRLCRALHVSMDDVFKIVPSETPEQKTENERIIHELQSQCSDKDAIIEAKDKEIKHYAEEIARWRPIVRGTIIICILLAIMLIGYLIFDIVNPSFGLFRG